MFKFDQVKTTFRITKCIISVITLLSVHTCECRHIYSVKGQSALLNFPFPCDSTEVTLQHTVSLPFYRSTDGFAVSLPQSQADRFYVQKNVKNGNCSLDLTISNLTANDEGTYLSTIYMDGQLLDELTTRIWLGVDHPPDKASCVKGQDKKGDWVAINCTANIGNLAGKIECYQNGQQIPPVTDPIEKHSAVTESFLIRKSQPAFCCSSILNEYKERCACDDAALNLADGDSNDPCSPSSTITTKPPISFVTENNQTDSTGVPFIPVNRNKRKCNDCVIIHSVLFPIEVLVITLSVSFWYRMKTKTSTNDKVMVAVSVHDDGDESVILAFTTNQHDPSEKAT